MAGTTRSLKIIVIVIIWCLFRSGHAFGSGNCTRENANDLPGADCTRQEVIQLLLDNKTYDYRISPDFEKDVPTNVIVQIFVMSVDSLNEASMDYTVTIFLRQKWVDSRLKYQPIPGMMMLELDNRLIDNVWVPDTYFPNEKSANFHYVTVPNKLMHLYANGTVFYSLRVTMTLSCDLKLAAYPLDSQECLIALESYSYTTDNVVFQWHARLAVQLEVERLLPQFFFSMKPTLGKHCEKSYNSIGNFSCLEATLHLTRNTGYYIAQIFIPSILIVMLSWVSFWVDAEATPARISLGILTVLTITTQSSGAISALPRVSYVKAIDVWMSTCLMFVFASLLEFAYINFLSRNSAPTSSPSLGMDGSLTTQVVSSDEKRKSSVEMVDFTEKGRMVDKVSRILFPTAFAIFNLIFWSYYLSMSRQI